MLPATSRVNVAKMRTAYKSVNPEARETVFVIVTVGLPADVWLVVAVPAANVPAAP